MLRLGSLILLLWAVIAQAQTIQPVGGGGGGAPSTITIPTTTTGCATANGVFFNSSNTLACASGFTTTGTEAVITSGTQTASLPVLTMTQTWNNAGVTFTGTDLNVTNTASAAASMLLNLRVGGVSQFQVTVGGGVTATGNLFATNILAAGNGQLSFNGRAILTSAAGNSLQFGPTDAAAPTAQTIGPQSVAVLTSNVAGVLFTIRGSRSTGSGVSGDIVLQTGGTGAGATAQNALVTALTIKGATQAVRAAAQIGTGGYTVSTLPAAVIGDRAYVTDQLTACVATGVALVGGGVVACPAFYNGAAWVGG